MLRGFRRREDGQMGLAEAEGKLQEGDRVVRLNGEDVESMAFHTLVSRIRGCTWPLTAQFGRALGQLPAPKVTKACGAGAATQLTTTSNTLAPPQQPRPPKQLRPRPASGFYGVSASGKRWQAKIYYDSKDHHLGLFDTKQEAALAYDRAARQREEDKLLNYESVAAAKEAAAQAHAEHALIHPKQPKPPPRSGFYGVSASGKRWKASIHYDSKGHHLGTFDTKQEAALAYDRAARQCGEDKLLNYESIAAQEQNGLRARRSARAGGHRDGRRMAQQPKQPRPRPASGFYGVRASGKRWQASFAYDSKNHSLGSFDTKQEAALAYDRAARQCGKDKPLNYESIAAAEEAAAQAHAEHTLAHPQQPQQPRPRPVSGFYGVSASGKRWAASIRYDSKNHHLSSFDTKQEAALAYDRAARQREEDKPLNYESIAAAEEAAAQAQAEVEADWS
jgi:hypothetical protein